MALPQAFVSAIFASRRNCAADAESVQALYRGAALPWMHDAFSFSPWEKEEVAARLTDKSNPIQMAG
jgi:hypothetical protein